VTSQAANVIDLDAYRARRNAGSSPAQSNAPSLDQLQPFPFFAPAFFFGFWPTWVMAPMPVIGCFRPGATE
jgi:hypothetical protein